MVGMISRTLYLFAVFIVLTMSVVGLGVIAFLITYYGLMAL